MIRAIIISLVIGFCTGIVAAQNLVPNYSFEDIDFDSCGFPLIECTPPWYSPTDGTPDIFHDSLYFIPDHSPRSNWAGGQVPRSGLGIAGIATWWEKGFERREYIQIKLLDTLLQGVEYYVEFHISLEDSVKYATDRIGVFLSDTIISLDIVSFLPFNPQIENDSGNILVDNKGWTKVSGSLIAQGGEQFLTIGNFEPDSITKSLIVDSTNPIIYAGYYIDDICVATDSIDCICYKYYPLEFYSDTTVIKQDSCVNYYIDPNIRYDFFEWQFEGGVPSTDTGRNPTNICYPAPGNYNVILMASDTNGCTDTIKRWQHMTVSPADHTGDHAQREVVKVYPNPSVGLIQVELPPELQHLNGVFTLFNIKGQKVLQTTITGKHRNDILLSRNAYPNGTYLYKLELDENFNYAGKMKLIR